MLTLTLNAALDTTYRVDAVRIGQSHRVRDVSHRAGGKGINVARVLTQLGRPVVVSGLVAGRTGARIAADVVDGGMTDALVVVRGESRRTVTVVDDSGATVFNEDGAELEIADWPVVEERFRNLMLGQAIVVASGSIPPCAPIDAYARLTRAAHDGGSRMIVDASGAALLAAAEAGADLLKPNADELIEATGCVDVDDGIAVLLRLGAGAVAASLGAEGLILATPSGTVRARPFRELRGNPTGAGDAAVAGFAISMESGWTPEAGVAYAVSLAAAAVAHPLAGSFDRAVLEQHLASRDGAVSAVPHSSSPIPPDEPGRTP